MCMRTRFKYLQTNQATIKVVFQFISDHSNSFLHFTLNEPIDKFSHFKEIMPFMWCNRLANVKLSLTSVLSFTNGGTLSGYLSLLCPIPWWDLPNLATGTSPPSCLHLDNHLYMIWTF